MLMKNQKLLLEILKGIRTSKDGILYTEDQNHKSSEGIIKATGSKDYPLECVVVFSEFSGEIVWVNDKKYKIIDEEDVWAIKEDK